MTMYLVKLAYVSGPHAGSVYYYGKGGTLIPEEVIPLRIRAYGYSTEGRAKSVCARKKKSYVDSCRCARWSLGCEADVEVTPFPVEV